jgi:hypothetical protein
VKTAEKNSVECDSDLDLNEENEAIKRLTPTPRNELPAPNGKPQSEAEQEDIEREENEGGPVL